MRRLFTPPSKRDQAEFWLAFIFLVTGMIVGALFVPCPC